MARKKRSTRRSASTTPKRKTYKRRRRSSGLSGFMGVRSSAPKKDIKGEMMDIALAAAGTFAAAKGVGMLDKVINKPEDGAPSKVKSMIAPAAVTVVGVAGAVLLGDRLGKSLAKGVALGGALKLTEKALGKDNLLAGIDEATPTMIPGIGAYGQASLPEYTPEMSHYSNNPDAPATVTGGSYGYQIPQTPDTLSGDGEIIAY